MIAAQFLALFLRDIEPCRKLVFEEDKEQLRMLEVPHLVRASPATWTSCENSTLLFLLIAFSLPFSAPWSTCNRILFHYDPKE